MVLKKLFRNKYSQYNNLPTIIQLARNSAFSIFCAGDLTDYSHQCKRSSTTPNIGRQPVVPVELAVTAQAVERVDLPVYIRRYTNSVTCDAYTDHTQHTQDLPYFP